MLTQGIARNCHDARAAKTRLHDTLGERVNAFARALSTRRFRVTAKVVSNLQSQFYPVDIEQLLQRLQQLAQSFDHYA